jgi:hypothetical protein
MVQLLLKHGAQPLNASPGFTTLHAACMGSCSSPKAAVPAAPAQTCRPEGGPLLQDTCCPAMQPAQPQQPQDTAQQQQGKTQQPVPAAAPASNSKPGQLRAPTATTAAATAAAALKASAAGKAAQASSQHSKPAISTTHGRLAPAATGRVAHPKPAASSKAIVQAARTGVSLAAASKLRDKAAGATTGPSGATSAAADAAAVSAAPRAPAASAQQGVSQELVGTLLAAAPQLLQEKVLLKTAQLATVIDRPVGGSVLMPSGAQHLQVT